MSDMLDDDMDYVLTYYSLIFRSTMGVSFTRNNLISLQYACDEFGHSVLEELLLGVKEKYYVLT